MEENVFRVEVRGLKFEVDASEAAKGAAGPDGKGALNWTLLIQVFLEALMKYFAGSTPAPTPPRPAGR